jgi:hypothetical protein
MTYYSKLSDFEVNKRVALIYFKELIIGANNIQCERIHPTRSSVRVSGNHMHTYNFDPCNSWKDIGPILIREGFDLINKLDGTTCIQDPLFEGDFDLIPEAIDENPCKAIAICYLMKKDAESN